MITDIIVGVLAFLGTIFVFLAAVGLIRMPDTYLRLAVTTKAATLGVGLLLIAGAVHAYDLASTAKVLAIILFLLLTAPISAHLIGRTSYFAGIKLWKGSVIDELKGQYDIHTQKLSSGKEEIAETKTPTAKD